MCVSHSTQIVPGSCHTLCMRGHSCHSVVHCLVFGLSSTSLFPCVDTTMCLFSILPRVIWVLVLFDVCHTTTNNILNCCNLFQSIRNCISSSLGNTKYSFCPELLNHIHTPPTKSEVKSHIHKLPVIRMCVIILALAGDLSSLPMALSVSYLSVLTTWWWVSRATRDVWDSWLTCLEPVLETHSMPNVLGLFSIYVSLCVFPEWCHQHAFEVGRFLTWWVRDPQLPTLRVRWRLCFFWPSLGS